jgi:indolepyruvate decarboxylase
MTGMGHLDGADVGESGCHDIADQLGRREGVLTVFTQHIDPPRTIDVGHNQSVVAGQFFAPVYIGAALQTLTGILEPRGIRSRPLTPEALWNSLSAALTPSNVVPADQGVFVRAVALLREDRSFS